MVYGIILWFIIICGFWVIMYLYDTKKLSFKELIKYIALVVVVIFGAGYKLFGKYEIEKFEEVHNNEVLFSYIDSMSVVDLRNKLKACQINTNNCILVFPQK